MNKPRRHTDLELDDITCLIALCEKRLHTINTHLRKNHSTLEANSSILKAASQVAITLDKLKALKERTAH
jgi:hypothetical protein